MKEQVEAVQRMQDYIQEHLKETVTLADLSRVSLFSPWHSYRLFRQWTNQTPADYIRRLRLSESALKLRDEQCRIADVAFEYGFGSVDGYQRAFFREFGCNPREYAGNPVPLYLFTPYGVKYREIRKEWNAMENVKNENEDEEGSIAVGNTDTGYLINAEGMICGLSGDKEVIKDGVLYFPEKGCSGIARGALSDLGSAVEEIEIPANITNIQPGAFVGLSNLGWIEADEANPAYVTVDGVLYTADGTVLLGFPVAWTGTFQVPERVKSFAESAFDGTNLECIDARSCTLEQTESIPETVKLLE